jgi:hypothetical protein
LGLPQRGLQGTRAWRQLVATWVTWGASQCLQDPLHGQVSGKVARVARVAVHTEPHIVNAATYFLAVRLEFALCVAFVCGPHSVDAASACKYVE